MINAYKNSNQQLKLYIAQPRLADRVTVLADDQDGATIYADFTPASEPPAIFREVEGIIATLRP